MDTAGAESLERDAASPGSTPLRAAACPATLTVQAFLDRSDPAFFLPDPAIFSLDPAVFRLDSVLFRPDSVLFRPDPAVICPDSAF